MGNYWGVIICFSSRLHVCISALLLPQYFPQSLDGLSAYVVVVDATSGTAYVSALSYTLSTQSLSEAGRMMAPAGSPLDSKVYMSIGPSPGMLVTAGDAGVTIWRTLPSVSSSPTSSITSSSSNTPSASPTPSVSPSTPGTPSSTPTPTCTASASYVPPPPGPGAGPAIAGVVSAFALLAVGGAGAAYFGYRNPLVVARWRAKAGENAAALQKRAASAANAVLYRGSVERVSLLTPSGGGGGRGLGSDGTGAAAAARSGRLAMINSMEGGGVGR